MWNQACRVAIIMMLLVVMVIDHWIRFAVAWLLLVYDKQSTYSIHYDVACCNPLINGLHDIN